MIALASWLTGCVSLKAETYTFNPDLGIFERREVVAPGVKAIWFSSTTASPAALSSGRRPEEIWPAKRVFHRGIDRVVHVVFLLTGGTGARIDGVLRDTEGRERLFFTSVPDSRRYGRGAVNVQTYSWNLSTLPAGLYTVEVSVDDNMAGAHVFEVK